MSKIKNFELLKLQEDSNKLKENVDKVQRSILKKNETIQHIYSSFEENTGKQESIDIEKLLNHKLFAESLQDEILRETILEKSLSKRLKDQSKLISTSYGKAKLYEKMSQKKSHMIVGDNEKNEQKNIDELSASKKMLFSV